MDAAAGPRLPIGRAGRFEALALTGPDGEHAVLVRDAGAARALLTGAGDAVAGERLVITALADEVDVRTERDGLAVWIGSTPLEAPARRERVPAWASLIGLVMLLALVAFAVIGSTVTFAWLVEALGG